MCDDDLWSALLERVRELSEVSEQAEHDLGADAAWHGRVAP